MSDENPDRDSKESAALSKRELEAHAGASADEKTLLLAPTPASDAPSITDEKSLEPMHKFAALSEAQTALQNAPNTEPTKIFPTDETDHYGDEEIEAANDVRGAGGENALRPSRLRFALLLLMLVFTAGWMLLNFGLLSEQRIERDWRFSLVKNADGNYFVLQPSAADNLRVGDELMSVNGAEFTRENFVEIENQLKPGDRYTLSLRRDGQLLAVELAALPVSRLQIFNRYVLALFIPAVFLLVGGAVFLLKPNDKAVLLFVITFCLVGIGISPRTGYLILSDRLPPLLVFIYYAANVVSFACTAVAFHLFLIFPARLRLVRRFPASEYLLYLPCLVFIFLPLTLFLLSQVGWMQADANREQAYLIIPNIVFGIYGLAALTALLFNYFQTNKTNRRRIRLIAVALAVAAVPNFIISVILLPLGLYPGGWIYFLTRLPTVVFPFVFAYAIVRHRVIPVSFVIRRSLQYLLAKNALRLLLILPVIGIIWNIAANPNRTLGEILFQNSFAFYFFVVVAVALGVLMRARLSEWIDKKFFREQYNQERLLHELIEDVKESDSMPKLSRLVSSRIQSALHPTSVYLFYEDKQKSNFSVGYTTSENSDDLKFAADSPLLRFMQTRRGAVEFPLRDSKDLPRREREWLRSIGAELLVPMHGTDGKLAGFFVLGGKKSEIPYTRRDRELLESLANQIALMQENQSLKDRVRLEQKIKAEVLSRFDAGRINLLKECPRCGKCFDRTVEKCDEDEAKLTFSLPVERTIENRYRLERLIGKGGMGAVYEAIDTRINRTVAIKILSGASLGNRDALRRFEREAQTAGRLQHPNIINVFDYGVLPTEGAFLVMELFRGESLREILNREEKLNTETVAAWFGQVLDGVEAAHKQGIIHRDLKPDNILVAQSANGVAHLCILDFGLARLIELEFTAQTMTVPGMIMGTFGYMPPEQLRGERTDERSDLFAVGVMIYEALYGEKPFHGNSYQELLLAMTSDEFLSKIDKRSAEFFEKSLAQEPAARFASAGEMKRVLSISDFVIR